MPRKRSPAPWNKGKSVGQMRPLAPQQVQTIKRILEAEGNLRLNNSVTILDQRLPLYPQQSPCQEARPFGSS